MPNQYGLLGMLGLSPGIMGSIDPQLQETQFRQGAYNALAQQNGPTDAAILMGNPQAYGLGFQRQLFLDQLNDLQRQKPDISLNEALYRMSQGGQKEQFGINFGPPVKAGSAEVPTVYGQGGHAPHMLDVTSANAAPSSPQQSQPSQQPASSPLDILAGLSAKYKAQEAGATKAAETTAAAQPDLPILQSRSQTLIGKLQAIRDNPELSHVVGGPLGIKGRTGPLGQGQSDLINDIQDANNALQGDLFTSLRATSGRGVSPGALKEMRITDLQAGRTGTIQGYKDNIDKTIKQIQDEYEAAWKARGSSDAYKPNWASSAPKAPQFNEGQTATNRQTGQRILYTNGNWVPHP